jgi:1-acyl-sn-glycerol-3-phosphate acyltransferase
MLRRRLITVPGYFIAWLTWLAAAPLWLPATLIIDLVRRNRGVAIRSALMVTVYLSCEVAGILIAGALWVWRAVFAIEDDRWTDLHFRLEAWWGTTLFRAVSRIFGVRVQVEEDAELGRGPYILALRHSSTADTLLASALVSTPHAMRLRYVLKQEHLWDPSLDLVGNRVPNAFVDRFSKDPAKEVARVKALARDLGPKDGVLIYPEGTRFTQAKRARVLENFRDRGDEQMFEYAESLSCVLPPKHGGLLSLLDTAPEADLILCVHAGFEGTGSLADIWRGELIDQLVRVQFRRIERIKIPTDPEERVSWLLDEWREVGAWVERNHAEDPTDDE